MQWGNAISGNVHGLEAWASYQATDWWRLDGYALVEAGLLLRPDLKVVLMTGYAQEPPPALPRAIPILHKPFNLDRLCELASEMLTAG